MTNKEIHEVKEKILDMRTQYYSIEKISRKLNLSTDTVMLYIKILVSEGRLDEAFINLKKRDANDIKDFIFKLIHEGKNISQIADALEFTTDTIYKYLDMLIFERRLTSKEVLQCCDPELENAVLELREKGYTKQKIEQELHMGPRTSREVLEKLTSEGRGKKLQNRSRTEIKREIVKLIYKGYSIEEMSDELKVKDISMEGYINELINDGIIDEDEMLQKRNQRTNKKKKDIIALLEKYRYRGVVAKKLNISLKEVNRLMEEIIKETQTPKQVNSKRPVIFTDYNSGAKSIEQQIDSDNSAVMYAKKEIDECRAELAEYRVEMSRKSKKTNMATLYFARCQEIRNMGGKLTADEIDALSEIIQYENKKLNIEQLKFACVEYCKLENWKAANLLLTNCIAMYGGSKELVELRRTLLEIQEKQRAKDMIRRGIPISLIKNETRLNETELLRMKKEYEAQKASQDVDEGR